MSEIQTRIGELKDMLKTCGKVKQQEVTQAIMELQFVVEQMSASGNVEEGEGELKKAREDIITVAGQIEKT